MSKLSTRAFGVLLFLLLLIKVAAASDGVHINRLKPGSIIITGKVVDKVSGEGLIGVSIQLKNTAVGITTDVSGNFTISAPSDGILIASYIGFDSIEVPWRVKLLSRLKWPHQLKI